MLKKGLQNEKIITIFTTSSFLFAALQNNTPAVLLFLFSLGAMMLDKFLFIKDTYEERLTIIEKHVNKLKLKSEFKL